MVWVGRFALVLLLASGFANSTPQPIQADFEFPDACQQEELERIVCVWQVEFDASNSAEIIDLSWSPAALVELSIAPLGPVPERQAFSWVVEDQQAGIGYSFGYGISQDGGSGILFLDVATDHQTIFWMDSGSLGPPTSTTPIAVPGSYEVRMAFFLTLGGIIPDASAGGPNDPHIQDALDDVMETADGERPPYADIESAWFDDAILDDDVIEVGLVAPNLEDITIALADRRGDFAIEWTVHGQQYAVTWTWYDPEGPTSAFFTNVREGWNANAVRLNPDGSRDVSFELRPDVDLENGTLTARLPTRFIGSPGPGVQFSEVVAWSSTDEFRGIDGGQGSVLDFPWVPPNRIDEATDMVRPFALGGPEIWNSLRGIDSSDMSEPTWLEAPFSSENLPDTLQVLGALAAFGTFATGFVLVRRRRERLARLLDDVDAILEVHVNDTKAALAALDRLQARFDQMMREGKLRESHHTVLQTRIERSGYRLIRPTASNN